MTLQKLAEMHARHLLRLLPGFRTVPPSHGDVLLVAERLIQFRRATLPRRPRLGRPSRMDKV